MCNWGLPIRFSVFMVFAYLFLSCDQDVQVVQTITIENQSSEALNIEMTQTSQNDDLKLYSYKVEGNKSHTLLYGIDCVSECKSGRKWQVDIKLFKGFETCFYKLLSEGDCYCKSSTVEVTCNGDSCTFDGSVLGADSKLAECL